MPKKIDEFKNGMVAGVLFSAQYMVKGQGQQTYAEQLLRESGFGQSTLLKAQKESGLDNKLMNKVIREAFRRGK